MEAPFTTERGRGALSFLALIAPCQTQPQRKNFLLREQANKATLNLAGLVFCSLASELR